MAFVRFEWIILASDLRAIPLLNFEKRAYHQLTRFFQITIEIIDFFKNLLCILRQAVLKGGSHWVNC